MVFEVKCREVLEVGRIFVLRRAGEGFDVYGVIFVGGVWVVYGVIISSRLC